MIGVFPIIFVGWKLFKRTKWLKPHEVILRTAEVDEIDEYTANYVERTPKTKWHGYVDKLFS
jgi:amino acid transporter